MESGGANAFRFVSCVTFSDHEVAPKPSEVIKVGCSSNSSGVNFRGFITLIF